MNRDLLRRILALRGIPLKLVQRVLESSPATLHDDVQGLLGQKFLGRPRFTSQTAFPHVQDFGIEVRPEFFRVVGIVMSAETFLMFPFVFLGNALLPETTDI